MIFMSEIKRPAGIISYGPVESRRTVHSYIGSIIDCWDQLRTTETGLKGCSTW